MLLPVKDDNPVEFIKRPYVTLTMIAVCIAVFVIDFWVIGGDPEKLSAAAVLGGFDPRTLSGNAPTDGNLPPFISLFSSMFIHGGLMHLAGNMLFLWVFGDNVEDALGHRKFLLFYFASGLAGAFLFAIVNPDLNTVLIGASGAIAGVLGGYLVLYPKVWLWALVANIIPLKVPAAIMIGLWIFLQFVSLGNTEAGVAWEAHIGGAVFGIIAMLIMKAAGYTHPIGADGKRIQDNRSFVPKVSR